MPYQWSGSPPEVRLTVWPHRSLPKTGFVAFIAATAGFLSLPLFAVLGSALLWGLLPFAAATVWGLWVALARSYRSGELREEMILTPTLVRLRHLAPGRAAREWEANPYWLRPELCPSGGPVPDYLTLSGGPRTVELGRCLSAQERRDLYRDLCATLAALTRPDTDPPPPSV